MDSQQVRQAFIDFFVERDHLLRPSASLIPVDPTLLLNNAGMVPFKPYFLGEQTPPAPRVVSIQKCVRTIDIDIIGTTQRHLSFFEMMGNFSFGDYFKERAIPWAYEFVTERLGLDPERLWYTVYKTDEEAREIWIDTVGIPPEKVQYGEADNFWQMGIPGPCGPCSEIFFDKGPAYGREGGPIDGDEDRYVEIWNLVFMQNIQDEPYHVIGDLPAKNIDTGMGLERTAGVLQGVDSVFDIDGLKSIREDAAAVMGVAYGSSEFNDISLRILADHARTIATLIGDGVVPSNDGRGYVLRRVLRRAVRRAWQLRAKRELITPVLVDSAIKMLGEAFPELTAKKEAILSVVIREEERFRRTLASGLELLETEISNLGSEQTISGATAFKLHDTYGFPIELTTEIAQERGVSIYREGFDEEMGCQRRRARKAWRGGDEAANAEFYRAVLDETGLTTFIGYEHETGVGRVLAIARNGELIERADEGMEVEIFVDATPFYAEAGGQVGDSGTIVTATGEIEVGDTRHALAGLHGHRSKVKSGFISVGQEAELTIDSPRREKIRKSHTGTHVLHWALRRVLGEHAQQAGSLVEPGRLRFDFSHHTGVGSSELAEIESLANTRLIENGEVTTAITSKEEAERQGALAFFGDKYGDTVRLVKIGQFSVELCGGTHTHTSGQVGPLVVTSESSIGSNIRRVEALTGETAYDQMTEWRDGLTDASRLLRTSPSEVPQRVKALLGRVSELQGHLDAFRQRDRDSLAAHLAGEADTFGSHRLVVSAQPDLNPEQLRLLAMSIRDRIGSGVVVVGSDIGGKGSLVGTVSRDLVDEGLSAADLIAGGAKLMGGGGSRDRVLSQAGGPDGSQLARALENVIETASKALGGMSGRR
ncbi:MAG: alanine--tRNA ligase [Acidimicrobiia bacterium]|nr:alanine--tRNA ligase [Acidimicrobiia bacterium]